MPQIAQLERDRLNTYVEVDVAAWVRKEANVRGYTTSAFIRLILTRVREEMLHGGAAAAMLTGSGTPSAEA